MGNIDKITDIILFRQGRQGGQGIIPSAIAILTNELTTEFQVNFSKSQRYLICSWRMSEIHI